MICVQRLYHNSKNATILVAKKWQELRERDTIIVATDTVAVAARCQTF